MGMTTGYERIWETIEKVGICMLTTRTASGDFRARPVAARPDRANECLYFLTDARSAKEHEISIDSNVIHFHRQIGKGLHLSYRPGDVIFRFSESEGVMD